MQTVKTWLAREWAAVKKSGTMLWAWLNTFAGVVAAAVIDLYNDPTVNDAVRSLLDPKYLPYYLIAAGILLRFVRKKNATDL